MARIFLKIELDSELKLLYHNATLSGKLRTESDYEADLFESELNDHIEREFSDIRYTFPEILDYGEVYAFGRGGRTLAPENLIETLGGSRFRIKGVYELNLTPLEMRKLLKTLRLFNEQVRLWCRTVPDNIIMSIREDYKDDLEKNKNKKRKTITKTIYV